MDEYRDSLTEVPISFFTSVLSIFTTYLLQRLLSVFTHAESISLTHAESISLTHAESISLTHKVHPVTRDLIQKLSTRFLKPEICQDELSMEMAFDPSSFLPVRKKFANRLVSFIKKA